MDKSTKKAWKEYGQLLADALIAIQCFGGWTELQLLVDAYSELSKREKMAAAELDAARSSKDKQQVRDLGMGLTAIHFEMGLTAEAAIKKCRDHARNFRALILKNREHKTQAGE